MAIQIDTSLEALSRSLNLSVQRTLEDAIKAEMMKTADAIVSRAACEMARSLHGRIVSWNDYRHNAPRVSLVLDGVEKLVLDGVEKLVV